MGSFCRESGNESGNETWSWTREERERKKKNVMKDDFPKEAAVHGLKKLVETGLLNCCIDVRLTQEQALPA